MSADTQSKGQDIKPSSLDDDRSPTGRRIRKDAGVPAPHRRRSPELYERMWASSARSRRTRMLIEMLKSTPPLTAEQVQTLRAALDEIEVVGDSSGTVGVA